MGNTNGKNGRFHYCKECEAWCIEAEEYKNNAADTRDVKIKCPMGFDGIERSWYSQVYSPVECAEKVKEMIKLHKLGKRYEIDAAL